MARVLVTRGDDACPLVQAYQASRQALVARVAEGRGHAKKWDAYDGATELAVEVTAREAISLLLTCRYHGVLGLLVEVESEDEEAEIRGECVDGFDAIEFETVEEV